MAPHASAFCTSSENNFTHLLRQIVLYSLSGLLFVAAFPPVEVGGVAWIALVPFGLAVSCRSRSRLVAFIAPFLGGMACYLTAFESIRMAYGAFTFTGLFFPLWLALGIGGGVHWLAASCICRLIMNLGLSCALALPVAWTAMEYMRSPLAQLLVNADFDLLQLGHTQIALLSLCQIADLGGVAAITFLVACANGWLADLVMASVWKSQERYLWQTGFGIALTMLAAFGYGTWRLSSQLDNDGPITALVSSSDFTTPSACRLLKRLEAYPDAPELIVLSETAAREILLPAQEQTPAFRRWWEQLGSNPQAKYSRIRPQELEQWSQILASPLLVGCRRGIVTEKGLTQHNSLVYVVPGEGIVGWYDKISLVPFSEFDPFPINDGQIKITPGVRCQCFTLVRNGTTPPVTLGVNICYETCSPSLHRELWQSALGSESPPDMVVNAASEDFDPSLCMPKMFLNIARFRAIEMHRCICRAVEAGYSAIIDGSGRVLALAGPDLGQNEGLLVGSAPLDTRRSVYMWLGDWLPISLWCFVAAMIGVSIVRDRMCSCG